MFQLPVVARMTTNGLGVGFDVAVFRDASKPTGPPARSGGGAAVHEDGETVSATSSCHGDACGDAN